MFLWVWLLAFSVIILRFTQVVAYSFLFISEQGSIACIYHLFIQLYHLIALEQEMAPHSHILGWKFPWGEEPVDHSP